MLRRRLDPRILGVLTAGVVTLLLVVVFTQSYRGLLHHDGRIVHVTFPAAPQLYPGDQVRMEGKQEGTVKAVERARDGMSLVTLEVPRDAGPIYRNAFASLSWKTLLGGSFYVDLDRGTPDAGPLGDGVIPPSHTSRQVELDDLQSVFHDGARSGLQSMFRELSVALSHPLGPANALAELARVAPDAAAAARAARGVPEDADVRRLVRSAAATMRALDTPDEDIGRLVEATASTLQVTSARGGDLQSTIEALPHAERTASETLARMRTTLGAIDGLTARLRPSVEAVQPSLAQLRGAVEPTDALLQQARPLLASLRPATRSLAAAASPARQLLTGLQPDLGRFDETILPYLKRPDPVTGKPTSTMFGAAFAHLGGLMSQMDLNGHFMRFPLGGGNTTAYLPCKTSITDGSTMKLLACESLQKAMTTYLSYLPKLGSVADRRGKR